MIQSIKLKKHAICPDCEERVKLAWDYDIINNRYKCRCLKCIPLARGNKFPKNRQGPLFTDLVISFWTATEKG
jgi:hypothetical protein